MKTSSFKQKLFGVIGFLLILRLITSFMMYGSKSIWGFLGLIALVVLIIALARLFINAVGSGAASGSSWFGGSGSSDSGGFTLEESMFNRIQRMYEKMASDYRKEGNYRKAAEVYLKLLKNTYRGAEILQEGKLYHEAAIIYLKQLHNKHKAAHCYELGKDYERAIKLYLDIGDKEKVGDLYKEINDLEHANHYFEMVADEYKEAKQFIKASLVYRYKIENPQQAQGMLMQGWEEDRDAYNCLNNYFNNITQPEQVGKALSMLMQRTLPARKETLLQVIKHEYKKHESLRPEIMNMAYEIIAERQRLNPGIISELPHFNPDDTKLVRDITGFRIKGNKIISG